MTLKRFSAALVALVFAPGLGLASQNNLYSPTTSPLTGLEMINAYNNALDALATCNSGTSAPANAAGAVAKAGQCWIDTTTPTLLKKYVYSGSAWILESVIDVTNGLLIPPVGGSTNTLASGSTTDLGSVPQFYVSVTGTTTITAFGTPTYKGAKIVKIVDGLTLTHNGTSLQLPGAASIAAAAGSVGLCYPIGGANWSCPFFQPADGSAVRNPAVSIADISYTSSVSVDAKSVLGYGQALSRATYPDYFAAVTSTQSVTRSTGSRVLTGFADTSFMGAGMPVEGTGIPSGATIASVDSGTQITLDVSHAASSSGTSNVSVITTGYGSGGSISTVGVIDCRGTALAGRDNQGGAAASRLTSSFFGANGAALNAFGGSESRGLTVGNLAAHTHPGTTDGGGAHSHTGSVNLNPTITSALSRRTGGVLNPAGTNFVVPGAEGDGTQTSLGPQASGTGVLSIDGASGHTHTFTTGSAGSGTAFAIVPPTRIANCKVRVLN